MKKIVALVLAIAAAIGWAVLLGFDLADETNAAWSIVTITVGYVLAAPVFVGVFIGVCRLLGERPS